MGETKVSEFNKVLSAWDVLVIAFGAMIGWGWVVYTGDWITKGGVLGGMIGFLIGGIMIYFVGLTYAELTSAMPQAGGEHVFSFKAMGPLGSFVCTWAIVLGYVSVVGFEATALPTIVTYLYPDFLYGYLYTVAGFDIYASWLATAVIIAALITYVNVIGVKTAAFLQTALTIVIGVVGILLIVASVVTGSYQNVEAQALVGLSGEDILASVLGVAMVTPWFFIGFDVIPQAAEEINVSLKKIGVILIVSIVLAVLFYALVIFGVGYVMNSSQIQASMKGTGLVSADAMALAFNSTIMAKVLIVGGMCGILTSWNSFLIGGSRAMYSMADSYMIPAFFKKLHPKYHTPVNALALIGLLSMLAPFFGRKMLVWIVDAGNFGCVLAYCFVAVSFVILRKKAPEMARPYKVKHYKLVGFLAVVMSGTMIVMYLIPGSPAALAPVEWGLVIGWAGLGVIFGGFCKYHYKEKFGTHVGIAAADEAKEAAAALVRDEDIDAAVADTVTSIKAPVAEEPKSVFNFNFGLPIKISFGADKLAHIGDTVKTYGTKALVVTDKNPDKYKEMLGIIGESLAKAGVPSVGFNDVSADILAKEVANGAAIAKEHGCDVVIAVGDGKIINYGKAIAGTVLSGGLANLPHGGALPTVAVPTSLGSGVEANGYVIVADSEGKKKVYHDTSLIPAAIIAEPEFMMNVPDYAIATGGFNALSHNIGAYISNNSEPITDALALHAIQLLVDNLPLAYEEPGNKERFEKIVLAGIIGGIVMENTGITLAQKMAFAINKKDGLSIGQGLAIVSPVVMKKLWRTNIFKYGKLARILSGFTADDCAIKIRSLAHRLGLDMTLGQAGLSEADLDELTERCMELLAPKDEERGINLTRDEVYAMYQATL